MFQGNEEMYTFWGEANMIAASCIMPANKGVQAVSQAKNATSAGQKAVTFVRAAGTEVGKDLLNGALSTGVGYGVTELTGNQKLGMAAGVLSSFAFGKGLDDIDESLNISGLSKPNVKNKYPQRTDAAQAECQHVVDVFNDVKGNSNKKNTTVHVFLHEDGTVSVGISGESGSIKTINAAKKLEVALNDGLNTKKYTVGSVIDESLANKMKNSDKGIPGKGIPGNDIGDCAEPKAATVASKNSSPIIGMDTRWRLGDAPKNREYSGSNKTSSSQMSPCATCEAYEEEYMELANRNKRYKDE